MDDLSELKISPASTNDAEFAWPLYRNFIKSVLFTRSSDAPEWDETREKTNFQTRWHETNNYAISLDGRLIGWVSATEEVKTTTLENMFIAPEFQNRGIGLMLFKEMSLQWRKDKKKVVVPILMLSQYGNRLKELVAAEGFVKSDPDGEVTAMESNW